jgi:sugar phosphate isomerase/epimerase
VGALCPRRGIRLAYHNHSAEFAKVDGGPTGYDVLMRETDRALVDFEMDLYWTAFADQDPRCSPSIPVASPCGT